MVDIYPTLLELAGLPPKPANDGQSLVPFLKNPGRHWERPALMTEGPGNHAVRSDRWRYIRYGDGVESSIFLDRDALFRPELAERGKPDQHGRGMLRDWELGLAVNHAQRYINPDKELRKATRSKTHRHDPGAKQKECEEKPHHQRETW